MCNRRGNRPKGRSAGGTNRTQNPNLKDSAGIVYSQLRSPVPTVPQVSERPPQFMSGLVDGERLATKRLGIPERVPPFFLQPQDPAVLAPP